MQSDKIIEQLRQLTLTPSSGAYGVALPVDDWEKLLRWMKQWSAHSVIGQHEAATPHNVMSHFILFGKREDAGAFATDLPDDCTAAFTRPEDPDDQWTVIVKGPWDDPDEAERVLGPLAARYHGEYDGPEDT